MSTAIASNFKDTFATVRAALAGRPQDYTQLPIGRAVALLAIPMVLEMAMESVFAVVDMFFVGRLGIEAIAAVGLTEAMATIIYALAVGLSAGTTAMVARRVGEKDPEAGALAAVQAMILGLLVALAVSLPGAVFAPDLLRLMGGEPGLVAQGAGYTRILLGGSLTITQIFLLNAVFRGAGDAALAMRVLWLANGVNLVLDPCLIFGLGPFPQLGLPGAALATTVGRGTGVLFQLYLLARGRGVVRLGRRHLVLDRGVLGRLARVSAGGVGQYLISTSSWIILVRLVGGFGSAAVAGYTIALRLIGFTILPSWGVANAAATLVGQNLGAGSPARAAASAWRAGLINAVFLCGVGVLFITGARQLVEIFTQDQAVIGAGIDALRIIAYGYGFYAFGMVLANSFNGAGDTRTPTILSLFCYWLFQIPLACWLSGRGGCGVQGVFWSVTGAEVVLTLAAAFAFRRGGWQRQVI